MSVYLYCVLEFREVIRINVSLLYHMTNSSGRKRGILLCKFITFFNEIYFSCLKKIITCQLTKIKRLKLLKKRWSAV